MPLTFRDVLDRDALLRATDAAAGLVGHPAVAGAWEQESALPGLTVGGLAVHLASQADAAVEFLGLEPVPADAPLVALADSFARADWFTAPVDAPENTSIRDEFNAMAAVGPERAAQWLQQSRAQLPAAVQGAGPTTYVPWLGCRLATDDFLVVRTLETVVHADDLAVSAGLPTPAFDEDVLHPVLALLAVLGGRRHGQDAALRALARAERATAVAAAF
ncbi:maleylpyruvate isomerase N-terminal domain-containing protein [Microlunatus capsulatus]|uniref:Mycothiol-dependent maleylpyruvate isomerase metal-binding domain-containing protein n=1 Tax=Microlunatus capsulatus TaxID=99117 RepID=A0ABS4Z288_9ACTN|nr:maleylpyruvate isomerase N-terminal domain-containing protein [Microlunatus capsulatus]MBP2415150.1 hypothetical protein [Microlunatus capsulatus]